MKPHGGRSCVTPRDLFGPFEGRVCVAKFDRPLHKLLGRRRAPILKHRRGTEVPAISRELVETIQLPSEWITGWTFQGVRTGVLGVARGRRATTQLCARVTHRNPCPDTLSAAAIMQRLAGDGYSRLETCDIHFMVLSSPERSVSPVLSEQRGVCTPLRDDAGVHDHDLIGVHDR